MSASLQPPAKLIAGPEDLGPIAPASIQQGTQNTMLPASNAKSD